MGSFELHARQMHDAVADLRPLETTIAAKALVDQNEARGAMAESG
ncbi:hypothetical protein ACVIWV_003479 [Bradyrhizobium diazoefficiens]